MPCYDSRSDCDSFEQKIRLDAATRAACDLARAIQSIKTIYDWRAHVSPETIKWVESHEAEDAARMAGEAKNEADRQRKIAKLLAMTQEERELLGVQNLLEKLGHKER